jgi:hypothetical protein
MPYHKFTLDKVKHDFNLELNQQHLFPDVLEYPLDNTFIQFLRKGIDLANPIGTEKAKSEFIVAPLLLELKSLFYEKISLFSGTELNVDKKRGLNGVCDFIIAKENQQYLLENPIITLVEAKNDNIGYGLGQCIAEMYAASLYNQQKQNAIQVVYGIVTTGNEWKFLKLQENTVTIDSKDYFISELTKLFGILVYIIENA